MNLSFPPLEEAKDAVRASSTRELKGTNNLAFFCRSLESAFSHFYLDWSVSLLDLPKRSGIGCFCCRFSGSSCRFYGYFTFVLKTLRSLDNVLDDFTGFLRKLFKILLGASVCFILKNISGFLERQS